MTRLALFIIACFGLARGVAAPPDIVVFLTDDQSQLDDLLALLSRGSEGAGSRPVRVFPIAYGTGADFAVLQAIAEASSSAVYDASDPRSINKVFAQVISNF